MPRVLMVCEPPDGGTPEAAVVLAVGMGAHGYEVEFAGPPDARRYSRLEAAGIPIHRLPLAPGYDHPLLDVSALRSLGDLVRDRRIDLIHCQSSKAGVLGRVVARRSGVPALFSPNSFAFVGDMRPLRKAVALAIERAMAPWAEAIVCCCEDERDVALRHRVGTPERLQVVHNACEPCLDCESDGTLAALRAQGPLAAAITPLRPQKTLQVFIDAAPLVLGRMPEARLAIVGDGPMRARLMAHASRRGLLDDERFAFLPFEPPAARYLRAIDLFVLPSAWEGFPIGVLEALACGVPQVATDVGGTSEAVTPKTGRLVPRHDAEALAEAMCDLLGDPDRRASMAAVSRQHYEERFTVARMLSRMARVYKAALAGR